jgi:hypothetical protein
MRRKNVILISAIFIVGLTLVSPASGELIGWWKLDDPNGTTFADSSGYGNNGTITNPDTNPVRWTDDGYKGRALNFTSKTNAPFTLCDAPITTGNLNTADATCSFWMKMPTSPASWGPIFVLLSQSYNFDIEPGDVGMMYVNVQNGGIWFGGSTTFNDNNWHHITVTFSTSNSRIVLYGDSVQITSYAGNLAASITAVRIGGPRSLNQWRSYSGLLDEVAVFNSALNAVEVQNLFWYGPDWSLFATNPSPADKATIGTTNVTLTWNAGQNAIQHHVYFGDNLSNVQNGTGDTDKGLTSAAIYSPGTGTLVNGKTYYWRVDEINGTNVWPGIVWSFTIAQKTAFNPVPADGTKLVDPNVTLSWTAGMGAVSHNVYFGTNPGSLPLVSNAQSGTSYDPPGNLNYATTYYWRVDEFDGTTRTGNVWSFKTTPNIVVTDPNLVGWYNFNVDEETIAIDWSTRGNHGKIIGQPVHAAGYDANAILFDGVDDAVEVPRMVQNDFTLMAWVKTATPGYEGTTGRSGSGLIWSDYSGGGDHFTLAVLGTKAAFETGPPLTTTISNRDVVTSRWVHVAVTRTQSTGRIEIFIDGLSDIAANQSTATQYSLHIAIGANLLDSRYFTGLIDEVRIYNKVLTPEEIEKVMGGDPALALKPKPANGATLDVEHAFPLSWTPGEKAAKHDVYFGTDLDAVSDATTTNSTGIYQDRKDTNTYTPPDVLQWGKTYYWRIDEYNKDATISKGRVWTFTVADYLVVDDFEDYNNFTPDRVFQTWLDGVGYSAELPYFPTAFGGNGTGAVVGHDIWSAGTTYTTIMERSIFHGGRQSMPVDYNNAVSPYYSETQRVWATSQNWTRLGVKALTLWFRGIRDSIGSLHYDQATSTYTMTGSGTDIWGTSDQFNFAYKTLTGDGSIIAKIESLENTSGGSRVGVMIRETLDPGSALADVIVTQDGRVALQYRTSAGINMGSPDSSTQTVVNAITLPHWVKLTRQGTVFTAEHSTDGVNWVDITPETAGELSHTTVGMGQTVCIGLAVTARNAATACHAKISNVTINGTYNPTGPFTSSQDIGMASNDATALYITLEDDTAGKRTVTHTNANAVLQNTWQEWNISLSDFTGVKLDKIKKMTIGMGNKTPGGTGSLYIDDIRLYRPRCIPSLAKSVADISGDCLVGYADLDVMANAWLLADGFIATTPDDTAGLVGYWTLDGNANDSSGNANHGIVNGSPTWTSAGQIGGAAEFDGVNDNIQVARTIQDDFTIAAWIKTNQPGAQAGPAAWQGSGLIWSDVVGNVSDFVLAVLGKKLEFATGPTNVNTISNSDVVTGQWVHVAVTRVANSGQVTLYINGRTDVTETQANTGSLNANSMIIIGANTIDGRYYAGLIDEVRMYSRVLSGAEIAYLADTSPGDGQLYIPAPSADWYFAEAAGSRRINLRDYAVLANSWLEEKLWP